MGSLAYCDNIEWRNYKGTSYLIYVPDEVKENTDIFVFVHGGAEMTNENRYNDWNSVIQQQLNENGSDSIVIMPTMANRWDDNWASNTIDITELIQEEYQLQNQNVTSCGFSFGGWGAARTTIENIKRNPSLEPQVMFMLDDYGLATQNPSKYILGDGGQEAILENDSIVFSYVSRAVVLSDKVTDKTRQLDAYAKSGMNLVRVVCEDGSHFAIKDNFFNNNLIDYTNGNATLPENGYTYQVARLTVDPSSGEEIVEWVDVSFDEINTKEKLYNYFGINGIGKVNVDFAKLGSYGDKLNILNKLNDISISEMAGNLYYLKSDSELLQKHLNNIMSKIKSSALIQGTSISSSFSSTSNVPSQIPNVVLEILNNSASLLISLSNDLNEFAKVGLSVDKLDDDIRIDAENL